MGVSPTPRTPNGWIGLGTSTRIVSRDGRHGAAIWNGWFTLRVPCCRTCGERLHIWRAWNTIRTLLIAGGAFAFGMIYLLPRMQGWLTGLTVLGLIVVGFGAQFVWNRFFPPAFDVDPNKIQVEYEFRDQSFGEEFARLNDAA